MTDRNQIPELTERILAAAQDLSLPIDRAWLPAIAGHYVVNIGMARLIGDFPLPDETEPAPVFKA